MEKKKGKSRSCSNPLCMRPFSLSAVKCTFCAGDLRRPCRRRRQRRRRRHCHRPGPKESLQLLGMSCIESSLIIKFKWFIPNLIADVWTIWGTAAFWINLGPPYRRGRIGNEFDDDNRQRRRPVLLGEKVNWVKLHARLFAKLTQASRFRPSKAGQLLKASWLRSRVILAWVGYWIR